jgi:hypothetical protein
LIQVKAEVVAAVFIALELLAIWRAPHARLASGTILTLDGLHFGN